MGTIEVLGEERERKGVELGGREGGREGAQPPPPESLPRRSTDMKPTGVSTGRVHPYHVRGQSTYSLGSRDRREVEGEANLPRALFFDGSRFGFFEAFRAINPSTDRLALFSLSRSFRPTAFRA